MFERHPCPCCGFRTLPSEPPGTCLECPVCSWDDVDPEGDSTYPENLLRAQLCFEGSDGSAPELDPRVRDPRPEEARDVGWTTLWVGADERRKRLHAAIRAAFDGVALGGGTSLRDVYDRYGRTEESASPFSNHAAVGWDAIPETELDRVQPFPFLDDEGCRFYLPAYMGWLLRTVGQHRSFSCDATLRSLVRPDGFEILNTEQRRVVAEFLDFVHTYVESSAEIRRAIGLWRDFAARDGDTRSFGSSGAT